MYIFVIMNNKAVKYKILTALITLFFICNIFNISTNANYTNKQPFNISKDVHYCSYNELTDLLEQFRQDYPNIFAYESLGKTHQGRDIWLVKISDNVEINDSKKPDILYSGGMHGDEKPGYQTVIESMISILENYTLPNVNESFTARIRNVVNNSELFFIPMINPDGCEANKRKNGRENKCIFGKNLFSGVDICRNFDYNWEDADEHPFRYILIPKTLEDIKFVIKQKNFHILERSVVRYPLTDIGSLIKSGFYRGPYPFSEPESKAIKQVVENHSITIWLDYHIFGEEIRCSRVPKYNCEYDNITFYSIAENISKIDGYEIFKPPKCLNTSGGSPEWAYASHNIFFFGMELCPSMKPSVMYNEELMSMVFEDHLLVNLYIAERAIEMM
jgi:carboxypeptidase T